MTKASLESLLSERKLKIEAQFGELVYFKANLKFSTKKHNKLTKKLNELGGEFSIAESKILALEEKLYCIDPHLTLKTTSNAPKKSSNKPKKLRRAFDYFDTHLLKYLNKYDYSLVV